jgi:hypothetical protein
MVPMRNGLERVNPIGGVQIAPRRYAEFCRQLEEYLRAAPAESRNKLERGGRCDGQ